jgi:two-component system sensor histidine kinase YesM
MLGTISFSNEKAFTQANETLDYRLEQISGTVTSIFGDSDFLQVLEKNRNHSIHADMVNDIQKINRALSNMENRADILRAVLYLPPEDPLLEYIPRYRTMDSLPEADWYQYSRTRSSEAPWVLRRDEEGNNTISMLRNVYSSADFREVIAVIRIDLNTRLLIDILRNAINTEGSLVLLLNTRNEVLLSSSTSLPWPYADDLSTFIEQITVQSNFNTTVLDGIRVFTSIRKTSPKNWYRPDWTLLSIMPLEDIQSPINRIIRGVMIMAILSTIVFSAFALFFTSSITQRINRLISGMRKAQQGKLDGIIIPQGSDEITELMADFNYLIKRVSILLAENTRHMNEARRNELTALQYQINPHFLYNTLDLINWSALSHNIPEIYETVQSLSRFYKLSLNQGKSIVPLSDEIKHITAYMEIQNRRFENTITFITDVPEQCMDYSIVKLTLQPLVENAVLHGILKKEIRKGRITVSAEERDDCLLVSVHDDGIGIEEEVLKGLMIRNFSSGKSYGLSNVHARLRLHFGERYGLHIESIPRRHTKAILTLPRIKYDFS